MASDLFVLNDVIKKRNANFGYSTFDESLTSAFEKLYSITQKVIVFKEDFTKTCEDIFAVKSELLALDKKWNKLSKVLTLTLSDLTLILMVGRATVFSSHA